jgi:hypothetical protein
MGALTGSFSEVNELVTRKDLLPWKPTGFGEPFPNGLSEPISFRSPLPSALPQREGFTAPPLAALLEPHGLVNRNRARSRGAAT